jgi:hypothetical protein
MEQRTNKKTNYFNYLQKEELTLKLKHTTT